MNLELTNNRLIHSNSTTFILLREEGSDDCILDAVFGDQTIYLTVKEIEALIEDGTLWLG